jgi:hypothetical protein
MEFVGSSEEGKWKRWAAGPPGKKEIYTRLARPVPDSTIVRWVSASSLWLWVNIGEIRLLTYNEHWH